MGEGMMRFTKRLIIIAITCITVIGGGITGCTLSTENKSVKDILVVGNSITIHGPCSYWWGEWGMAASTLDNDYVHVLQKKLKCHVDVLGLYLWEVNHYDRAETLEKFDRYSKKYQWIVIQLGENIRNTDTIESDFRELVKYVRDKYKSKVVLVGAFWKNDKLDEVKKSICDGEQVVYIDLADLQDKQYYAGLGTQVQGDDGRTHIIEHKGVANHPNDKAMQIVAERIANVYNGTVKLNQSNRKKQACVI